MYSAKFSLVLFIKKEVPSALRAELGIMIL